ncbi:hypothetical protein CHU95_16355 [Niveispirillum lacus]|uniref:DUF6265 domain-containing protein n=1 Tax=Niveispirillum lacus TaxID=1981099 RepID=A0A255YUL4_9PROT|nr:DUF6265 family protein [Niveispirillum lacus]OYQ32374.1 hypothetical protein CHU95_16355 [Niveispirillum lacus]
MRALFLAGLLLLAAPTALSAEPVIDDLSWLAGQWVGQDGDRRIEEHYMRPAGGIILGMSRTVRPGKAPEAEFIRIGPDAAGQLAYHAHPLGQAPASFALIESMPGLAIFANPHHDFPQKITYRRTGDSLTATIEGPVKGGGVKRFGWSWRLAGSAP